MSSYRQHLYHIVFRTKDSQPTIRQNRAVGYGSFTCSYMDVKRLIEYIKNQQQHHQKISFEEEYRKLLLDYGITPDEKYFP
jgi:hypothetical protein